MEDVGQSGACMSKIHCIEFVTQNHYLQCVISEL